MTIIDHDEYAAWCGECGCDYCKPLKKALLKYISNDVAVLKDSIKELGSYCDGVHRIILYSAVDQDVDLYWYVNLDGTCYLLDEGMDADFDGTSDAEALAFFRKHWEQR
jgi:hypothetical protein